MNVTTAKSGLKSGTAAGAKPILVAGLGSGHSNAILAGSALNGLGSERRIWMRTPVAGSWNRAPVAVSRMPKAVNETPVRGTLQRGSALAHTLGARAPHPGTLASTAVNRLPVRILKPSVPRLR